MLLSLSDLVCYSLLFVCSVFDCAFCLFFGVL